LSCAYIGYAKENKAGPFATRKDGWTDEQITDFREDIERLKERFPDETPVGRKKRKRKEPWKPSIN
jgi:hypothetical protein